MVTLGTEESGFCREVRSFIIWATHSQVLVDTINRYSVDISLNISQHVSRVSVDMSVYISRLSVSRHVS